MKILSVLLLLLTGCVRIIPDEDVPRLVRECMMAKGQVDIVRDKNRYVVAVRCYMPDSVSTNYPK